MNKNSSTLIPSISGLIDQWMGRYDYLINDQTISDPESILPTQVERSAPEFNSYQRLVLNHIVLAVNDWNHLQVYGRVMWTTTGGDGVWTPKDEDNMVLFLCDDNYGRADDDFLSLATCCNAIGISVEDVRGALLGYGRDPVEWARERATMKVEALKKSLEEYKRRETKMKARLKRIRRRLATDLKQLTTLTAEFEALADA